MTTHAKSMAQDNFLTVTKLRDKLPITLKPLADIAYNYWCRNVESRNKTLHKQRQKSYMAKNH
ncbi:MAG: hypothetical protein Fur0025_43740 [Oscillatoriaceae cyanobacterium]